MTVPRRCLLIGGVTLAGLAGAGAIGWRLMGSSGDMAELAASDSGCHCRRCRWRAI
jgi:hypothetical protein